MLSLLSLHLEYDVDAYLYSITMVTIFDIQFLFVNMAFRIGTVKKCEILTNKDHYHL